MLVWLTLFNACNNFRPLSKTTIFFCFGALDESSYSSYGLCVGIVTRENCTLVNSYSFSNHLLPVSKCGNF